MTTISQLSSQGVSISQYYRRARMKKQCNQVPLQPFHSLWIIGEDTGRTDTATWMKLLYLPLCSQHQQKHSGCDFTAAMKSYEAFLYDKAQDSVLEGYPHSFHIQWMYLGNSTNKVFPPWFVWFHDTKTFFFVLRYSHVGKDSREM